MLQASPGARIHCLPGGFLHGASWGPPALISSAVSQLAVEVLGRFINARTNLAECTPTLPSLAMVL